MSTRLHIINAFESATRGSERAALEAARGLQPDSPVTVWSTVRTPPQVQAMAGELGVTIEAIVPFAGRFPKGGVLLIWGTHFAPGLWLAASHCERVVIINELFNHAALYRCVLAVRAAGLPEPSVIHVSTLLRDASAIDGPVLYPMADMRAMFDLEREPDRDPVVVGRVSRDVAEKHHADDPLLYRTLAAEGLTIRLMGGTVLGAALAGRRTIELLPPSPDGVAAFLAGIDIFFYRTGGPGIFVEPSGLVVAEAFAAGLPVVAVRPGGFADLFESPHCGFLVDTQDEAYAAIRRLARDPALRRTVGAAARRVARERFGYNYAGRLRRMVMGEREKA